MSARAHVLAWGMEVGEQNGLGEGGGCQVGLTNRKIRPDSLSQSKISFTGPHRRVRLDHRASSRHIASSSQLIIGCSRGGVMNDEGGGGGRVLTDIGTLTVWFLVC